MDPKDCLLEQVHFCSNKDIAYVHVRFLLLVTALFATVQKRQNVGSRLPTNRRRAQEDHLET
jgi:hypothetical protein